MMVVRMFVVRFCDAMWLVMVMFMGVGFLLLVLVDMMRFLVVWLVRLVFSRFVLGLIGLNAFFAV